MNQNKPHQTQTQTHQALAYFWKKKTILSFAAVTLIVVIHNSATNQYSIPPDTITDTTNILHTFFAYILGSVAVPFFFFISGVAFFRNYKPNLYFTKLKSRMRTILIPYLIWNTVGLLFALLYTYTPLANYISGRELFDPSIKSVLEGIFLYKYNFQFWFLYDLIIYILLTPLIDLLTTHKTIGLATCIFTLFLPLITPSFLGINTNFTVFYIVGCFIGKHYLSLATKPSTKPLRITSLITTICLLIIKTLSVYNIISLPSTISQIILLLLLFSTYFASDLVLTKIKTAPNYIKESFPLYTLHTYFVAIIIKLIYLINPTSSIMLLLNEISSTVITIIIVVSISKLLHQKLPKLHNLLFGGR